MLFLTLLFALLTALASASAISPRAAEGLPGSVYICSGPKWTGTCKWHPFIEAHCFPIGAGPISVGPDKGGYCLMYRAKDCGLGQKNDRFIYRPGGTQNTNGFHSMTCFRDVKNAPDFGPP